MKKSRQIYYYLVVFIISILASFRLFQPGYFSMQDDMHVFRLQQFDKCIKDYQIPCRQIPDGGLGYGYPLYNYYSPLPYAIAESFHLLGLSFINSIKIVFIIPNFIRSISMFLLASAFFGPLGGILSSTFYTLAPYLAVDSFVRGALAEFWALSLLPLVIYSLYKSKPNLFIISLTALLLSHNLTVLYFAPVIFIFAVINRQFRYFTKLSLYALLIPSFFIIPAFLEKNLITVNTMTQGYFSYIIHFATLKQIFLSNYWGYSASQWGPVDGLSFQVGYLLWIIPLIAIIYQIIRHKQNKNIFFFFLVGLFAIFLTHNQSTFLWKNISLLEFYQFPWRFIGLAVFCFSVVSGQIVNIISPKYQRLASSLIIILMIIINVQYFHEDIWYQQLSDNQKLTPSEVTRQSGAGLKDYWSKSTQEFPVNFANQLPTASFGQISNLQFKKNSQILQGQIFVISDTATILFPQTYFPNWNFYLNGQPSNYQIDSKYGQLKITLLKGDYYYTFRFVNSPIRTIANILSLFGVSLYIIKLVREKKS